LGIPNSAAFKPTSTYLADAVRGIDPKDRKLIVCYDKEHADKNKEYFSSFESRMLVGNKLFVEAFEEESCMYYVFDLSKFSAEYDKILEGKYSELSHKCKLHIDKYHTSHIGPNAHMRRYLFVDDKAYSYYANELGVTESQLKEVGELCSPPDMDRETLQHALPENIFV